MKTEFSPDASMPYKASGSWMWNFRTEVWEAFNGNLRDVISQVPPALNMYDLLLQMGKTPEQAFLHVSKIAIEER